jgi:hypothetical protein
MKHILLIVLSALLLSSCAYNNRSTEITIYSGSDTTIDASGASNTTDTGQMPQADLTPLVDAAKAAISGKATSIIDKVTDILGNTDSIVEEVD